MVDVQQEPLIVAAGPCAAVEWVDMGFAGMLSLILEQHAVPMEDVGPDAPKTLLEAAANSSAFGPKGGAVLLDVARALLYESQCVVDYAAPTYLILLLPRADTVGGAVEVVEVQRATFQLGAGVHERPC